MLIIAGHTRMDADKRDAAVAAYKGLVERARAQDGCLDFAVSADAVDAERVNLFERWRDRAALDAWRKVARGGPRARPREIAVSLYRTEAAEKPF